MQQSKSGACSRACPASRIESSIKAASWRRQRVRQRRDGEQRHGNVACCGESNGGAFSASGSGEQVAVGEQVVLGASIIGCFRQMASRRKIAHSGSMAA